MSEKNEKTLNTEPEKVEREELEQVSGGDIFDKMDCWLRGHDWENVDYKGAGSTYHARWDRCSRCGKVEFTVKDLQTGHSKNISKSEYDNLWPDNYKSF